MTGGGQGMGRETFEAKIGRALAWTDARGIGRSTSAPPLHRLLWKLGVPLPPPLMAGFALNALFMGGFFGVAWGLGMWLLFWRGQGLPSGLALVAAIAAGVLFGLAMAWVLRRQARRHGVPAWDAF